MRISRMALSALLFSAAPALADDLDGAKAGELQGQIELKQESIKKEYDGRKLNSEERKERDQRLKDAANEVLEKNGTNDKDFSRATKHMNRDEHEEMEQARKATKSKAKESHPQAEPQAAPDGKKGTVEQVDGIVVEKGTDAAKAEGAADGANGDGNGNGDDQPPPTHSRHKHH